MLNPIIKNAIIGDGHLIHRKYNCALDFKSKDSSYLDFKEGLIRDMLPQYKTIKRGKSYSGYRGDYSINSMTVSGIPQDLVGVTEESVTYDAIIPTLTEFDLFLWYLDDGSWHKSRNTMHLYSNILNEKQTNALADHIESMYGIRPRLKIDRKKDGREFYYLYYPRKLVNILHPIYRRYLLENGLETMYYKVGGMSYVDKPAA